MDSVPRQLCASMENPQLASPILLVNIDCPLKSIALGWGMDEADVRLKRTTSIQLKAEPPHFTSLHIQTPVLAVHHSPQLPADEPWQRPRSPPHRRSTSVQPTWMLTEFCSLRNASLGTEPDHPVSGCDL